MLYNFGIGSDVFISSLQTKKQSWIYPTNKMLSPPPPTHEHRFMIDLVYLSPMNIEFKFDCNIAYNRNCTELPSMPRLQCPITMFTLLSF